MEELWVNSREWFMSLGEKYNVDPILFGSIYVGAIPFFFASLGWVIKNIRKRKSVFIPVILTAFFFISAYLYLIIAGRKIPAWVYVFIAIVVLYGIISTINKVRRKVK